MTLNSEMSVYLEAETNVSDGGHPSVQHRDSSSDRTHPSLEYPTRTGDQQGLGISGSSPEALAVRAYCKYAVLFFLALLITWVSYLPPAQKLHNELTLLRYRHQQTESTHYLCRTSICSV